MATSAQPDGDRSFQTRGCEGQFRSAAKFAGCRKFNQLSAEPTRGRQGDLWPSVFIPGQPDGPYPVRVLDFPGDPYAAFSSALTKSAVSRAALARR